MRNTYGLDEKVFDELTYNEKRVLEEISDIYSRSNHKKDFSKAIFNIIQGSIPAYELQSEVLSRINQSYSEGETYSIRELAELGANNLYIDTVDGDTINIYDEDYSVLPAYLTPDTEVEIVEIYDTMEGYTVIQTKEITDEDDTEEEDEE